jgi:hypothetical protein
MMGKAIAVGFFFVGFIIFTFFKHASKGVRKAYEVVNEDKPSSIQNNENEIEEEDRAITVMKEAINSTLDMQFMLGGYSQKKKPQTDYVVGYVIGYVDAFCQLKKLDDVETFGILTTQLFDTYGPEDGVEHLEFYMKNQSKLSDNMRNGINLGGTDVFAWLNEDKEQRENPIGLMSYLQKNKP